jgi:hypothetical protein
VVDIYGIMFSNKLDTIYILILMHDPTFFFFSSLGFNEKLLTKQMWFFLKIIFSSFWALQFPNLLLPRNFDPFSYMGYIYGIYLKKHISAKKLDIRYHIYMVTHIWDIYCIYPKQHMFAKKLKIEQKLNEIKMRKKLTSRRVP